MADRIVLEAGLREEIGTKKAKMLRKAGKVPAILYGHGEDAVALTLNLHDLTEGLHHGHRLYDADLNGKSETMLIKDLQYDYLGKEIIHADFVRVDLAEIVTVSVALKVLKQYRLCHQVIHRYIEKTLKLSSVHIDRQNPVGT